jgi:hypothetical protein
MTADPAIRSRGGANARRPGTLERDDECDQGDSMLRGFTSGAARSARGNTPGIVPLLAGIGCALTLTGAAVYTVEAATCSDAGQYIRHDNHIELVGGCVDGSGLPGVQPESGTPEPVGDVQPSNLKR